MLLGAQLIEDFVLREVEFSVVYDAFKEWDNGNNMDVSVYMCTPILTSLYFINGLGCASKE